MIRRVLNLNSITDYDLFLKIKALPVYQFVGREARIPDEYAERLGIAVANHISAEYEPIPGLWDYQGGVSRLAIQREKFAVFADCGRGKTAIMLEVARHVERLLQPGQCVLMVSPLMVIRETLGEARRLYGDALPIAQVKASDLTDWIVSGTDRIGITNYEALTEDTPQGRIVALFLDESSMLKSHYGKWGQTCIRLGKGLRWKLALTGTPAPNDRIEYANHAVFLDAEPTVNSFLAKYFVNKGQTENRWEMKPHALAPFYRSISHWCIFLNDPATYGWKDNTGALPPINIHIHDVELTKEQDTAVREMTGMLFAMDPGGITTRGKMAQIAKGRHNGKGIESLKPDFIKNLVESSDASTIIWCRFNPEQDALAKLFPDAASVSGNTNIERRMEMVADFKAGKTKVMISKGKILGFGLNLQIATRHIFSSLHDSYEEFYQCIKRSNRYGAVDPLDVHIPMTEIERPMIENVLRKAQRVQADTVEQERIFRACSLPTVA